MVSVQFSILDFSLTFLETVDGICFFLRTSKEKVQGQFSVCIKHPFSPEYPLVELHVLLMIILQVPFSYVSFSPRTRCWGHPTPRWPVTISLHLLPINDLQDEEELP